MDTCKRFSFIQAIRHSYKRPLSWVQWITMTLKLLPKYELIVPMQLEDQVIQKCVNFLGYYCPAGTGKDLKSCPRGTYGPEKGYYEVSQCKPCKAGMYCGYEHMVNVTTKCAAGHWCAYGVDRPKPFGRNSSDCNRIDNTSCPHFDGRETGLGGICPLGSYCPEG